MSDQFNPGVDSIPEDRVLFFNPYNKQYREVENLTNVTADELLKKLLKRAKVGVLGELQDKLSDALARLAAVFTPFLIAAILFFLVGVFILEKILKYLFIYLGARFKRTQLLYLRKLEMDRPGEYYFKNRTKRIKLKPTRAEVNQYARCRRFVEEALFI